MGGDTRPSELTAAAADAAAPLVVTGGGGDGFGGDAVSQLEAAFGDVCPGGGGGGGGDADLTAVAATGIGGLFAANGAIPEEGFTKTGGFPGGGTGGLSAFTPVTGLVSPLLGPLSFPSRCPGGTLVLTLVDL